MNAQPAATRGNSVIFDLTFGAGLLVSIVSGGWMIYQTAQQEARSLVHGTVRVKTEQVVEQPQKLIFSVDRPWLSPAPSCVLPADSVLELLGTVGDKTVAHVMSTKSGCDAGLLVEVRTEFYIFRNLSQEET